MLKGPPSRAAAYAAAGRLRPAERAPKKPAIRHPDWGRPRAPHSSVPNGWPPSRAQTTVKRVPHAVRTADWGRPSAPSRAWARSCPSAHADWGRPTAPQSILRLAERGPGERADAARCIRNGGRPSAPQASTQEPDWGPFERAPGSTLSADWAGRARPRPKSACRPQAALPMGPRRAPRAAGGLEPAERAHSGTRNGGRASARRKRTCRTRPPVRRRAAGQPLFSSTAGAGRRCGQRFPLRFLRRVLRLAFRWAFAFARAASFIAVGPRRPDRPGRGSEKHAHLRSPRGSTG